MRREWSGNYQPSPSGTDTPLKPAFASNAIILAQNTAAPGIRGGGNPASAPAKTVDGQLSLADEATNPIANLMQLQFQNSFIGDSYQSSGYSNAFVIQPVIPVKFSDTGFFKFGVTRTTIPILSTANPDGPLERANGLGDITFLGLPVHEQKIGTWEAMWGVGLASTIPTASNAQLGTGKFTLGPSAILFLSPTRNWQTGILTYQLWDVAGDDDRTYVNKTFFQPILNYHFDSLFGQKGWYVGLGDILWTYDWYAQQLDLPIGVRLGKVFKAGEIPLNVFIEPFGRPVHNGAIGKWA